MNLDIKTKDKIKSHAERVFPDECCGFLIEEDQGWIKVIECKNTAEDKQSLFKISIEEYLQALVEGDICAVYHSHTKGKNSFSEADKINVINGVKVMGAKNILNNLALSASNLYAKNLFNFVNNLYDKEKKNIYINKEDEIISKTLIDKEQ